MTEQMNVPKLRFCDFDGEWDTQKIGDLCDFIVPGRNKPKTFSGTTPWITTPDLQKGKKTFTSTSGLGLTGEEIKEVGAKVVPEGSILMSCVGELGLLSISGCNVVINQQLHAFLPKKADSQFLLQSLSTKQRYMDRIATKTAVPYMNKDNCNSIPVEIPPLPEQQKIASFLSKVDEKIALLTEKQNKLTEYKKGVMQQLFNGKWEEQDGQLTFIPPTLRFKADDGSEFPDWEEFSLGSITTTMQSGISRQLRSEDIGYPTLRSNNLYEGKVSFEDVKYWYLTDDQGADLTRYILEDGDLLVNFINSLSQIGKVALYYNLIGRDAIYTTNIMRLKFKPLVTPEFAFYSFNTRRYVNFIQSIAKPAVSQASFTTVDFKKYRMHVPTRAEQDKITGFLLAIDRKIDLANSELEKAKEWKRGLLQQMFV